MASSMVPPSGPGPYTLRPLMKDVPLATGDNVDVRITCVQYWEGNLYIGTSAAEVLHFVCLPAESGEQDINYILASRLEPTSAVSSGEGVQGVQQIVILPRSRKACVLSTGTLTFHSLPELSPAAGNRKVSNCTWIGGTDLDLATNDGGTEDIIMVANKGKIRLLGIRDGPKLVKNIEYPGCLIGARRSTIACVADARSYALLDLDNQQKISLSPISSLDSIAENLNRVKDGSSPTRGPASGRDASSPMSRTINSKADRRGHGRSTSLGTFIGGLTSQQSVSRSRSRERIGRESPDLIFGARSPLQAVSPVRPGVIQRGQHCPETPENPLPLPSDQPSAENSGRSRLELLSPFILSPLSTEFLIMTGTSSLDPAVAMFVNTDGNPVRGTLDFGRYPCAIVLDNGDYPIGREGHGTIAEVEQGHILAAIPGGIIGEKAHGIESQRWDAPGEEKAWLSVPSGTVSTSDDDHFCISFGLSEVHTAIQIAFPDAGQTLWTGRYNISRITRPGIEVAPGVLETRDEFSQRMGRQSSRILCWSGTSVYWVVRNPLILRLDMVIDNILDITQALFRQTRLISLMTSVQAMEPRTEAEFLTLEYIRQKISFILFIELTGNNNIDVQAVERIVLESNLDPRIILSTIPLFSKDIDDGAPGISLYEGLARLIESRYAGLAISFDPDGMLARPQGNDMFGMIKRYLNTWRLRKGYGSIASEAQIFASVDAALLHVLLYEDQRSSLGPGRSVVLRSELYAVVDPGVSCFDRAVELLEEYHRLYVLSRLYQSRRLAGKVLETWRRIIEGDIDEGGEFTDGENEVRNYLVRIRDVDLVEEYATWLARRNPLIGVQVFTDDDSRVRLPPNQVVQLLQLRAPDAVKIYLEHLVFGKKKLQYANTLISYYLDNVLNVLGTSHEARKTLEQSYRSYRGLEPAKPTYKEFITENAIAAPWWHERLRLLELLGGSHGSGFSYDVPRILERIEPFEEYLVPESIILDGRQGYHQQALRLLTHGLGDYHTAINYCLLGGSSIFHPTSAHLDPQALPSREEQCTLFGHLLSEFLRIEEARDRLERTSELLERFGAWFDMVEVLTRIPDTWAVQSIEEFLVGALRRLTQEENETTLVKALCGAENMMVSMEFLEKCESGGRRVITAQEMTA